jgi:hypothetical protein
VSLRWHVVRKAIAMVNVMRVREGDGGWHAEDVLGDTLAPHGGLDRQTRLRARRPRASTSTSRDSHHRTPGSFHRLGSQAQAPSF